MKKYKKPSKSTKKCIEMGGTFIQSRKEYTPKRRGKLSFYNDTLPKKFLKHYNRGLTNK